MWKSNPNWDPDTKRAYEATKKGKPKIEVGIDPQSDERIRELGKNVRKKRGFWKFIIILIILLLMFDQLFMNGEILSNIIKNLPGKWKTCRKLDNWNQIFK